ncbi:hypothetical protein [Paraburkholderia sp. BCC1884]|uniref:hypothetical protein n=1 Tax=Paraburkholderia sp. BCC1884 TaxID=2562668 RepID=UPI0011839A88|nr:hypothetical protein [Paraburkholderia sp. BCC1884]
MTVFYQREGSREVHSFEAKDDESIVVIVERAVGGHLKVEEVAIFEEGCETQLTDELLRDLLSTKKHPRFHFHRCRRVDASVTYNGRTLTHNVAPSTTLASVKAWADKAFRIDPAHAAEHVLQLHGTIDRPTASTHVGALTTGHLCAVMFDLVPNERIQG